MESEKKIYIRGNEQHSNLINAYFKKLGIKNIIDDDYYTATDHIYYITHDDLVACCNEEYEMAYIIKDNYKEITIDELIKVFEVNKKVKVTLHPFDKVLAKCEETNTWEVDLFSSYKEDHIKAFCCVGIMTEECIPYNKDTAHLLGTDNVCPINYEFEFSKEFKE